MKNKLTKTELLKALHMTKEEKEYYLTYHGQSFIDEHNLLVARIRKEAAIEKQQQEEEKFNLLFENK